MTDLPSDLPPPPAHQPSQWFVGTLDRAHLRTAGPLSGGLAVSVAAIRIGGLSAFLAERRTIDGVEVDRSGRRLRVVLRSGRASPWFGGPAVPAALAAIERYGWPVRPQAERRS